MRKDNRLIAILSVFGILLVVLGHSGFEEPDIMSTFAGLHRWIYSFHMPLFFFISGYLFAYTTPVFSKLDAGKLLTKKVRRLLIPYFVLGSVLFAIKALFSQYSYADRDFSVISYCKMFFAPQASYSTLGYLWFLPALFLIFLIVALFCRVRVDLRNNAVTAIVIAASLSLAALLPPIDCLLISSVVWYLPFFLGGIIFQNSPHSIEVMLRLDSSWMCIILFILTIAGAMTPPHGFVMRVLLAIIGILFSIALCRNVLKFYYRRNIPLAKYTFSIYLLSWFGQYGMKILVLHFSHFEIGAYLLPLLFLAGVIFPVLCCKLVEKVNLNSQIMRYVYLIIGL